MPLPPMFQSMRRLGLTLRLIVYRVLVVVQREGVRSRIGGIFGAGHRLPGIAAGALVVDLHFEENLEIVGRLAEQSDTDVLLIERARVIEDAARRGVSLAS